MDPMGKKGHVTEFWSTDSMDFFPLQENSLWVIVTSLRFTYRLLPPKQKTPKINMQAKN